MLLKLVGDFSDFLPYDGFAGTEVFFAKKFKHFSLSAKTNTYPVFNAPPAQTSTP